MSALSALKDFPIAPVAQHPAQLDRQSKAFISFTIYTLWRRDGSTCTVQEQLGWQICWRHTGAKKRWQCSREFTCTRSSILHVRTIAAIDCAACLFTRPACPQSPATSIVASPLDSGWFATFKCSIRKRLHVWRAENPQQQQVPIATVKQFIELAVQSNAHHMAAYWSVCGITGAPAGMQSPRLPPATGTELPFGQRPIGAPMPRGASAAHKAHNLQQLASSGLPTNQLPELALDKVRDELIILKPVTGQGADAMIRAALRFQREEGLDTARFLDGRAMSAELSSLEASSARSLLKQVVAQLPGARLAQTVTTRVFAQALANQIQCNVQINTLSETDKSLIVEHLLLAVAPAPAADKSTATAAVVVS